MPVAAVILDGHLQISAQHIDPVVTVCCPDMPIPADQGWEQVGELELEGDLRPGTSPAGTALWATSAQADP